MGTIASGGVRLLNRRLVESLGLFAECLEAIAAKERREQYRSPPINSTSLLAHSMAR